MLSEEGSGAMSRYSEVSKGATTAGNWAKDWRKYSWVQMTLEALILFFFSARGESILLMLLCLQPVLFVFLEPGVGRSHDYSTKNWSNIAHEPKAWRTRSSGFWDMDTHTFQNKTWIICDEHWACFYHHTAALKWPMFWQRSHSQHTEPVFWVFLGCKKS